MICHYVEIKKSTYIPACHTALVLKADVNCMILPVIRRKFGHYGKKISSSQLSCLLMNYYYSALGAETGHTPAQAPHSTQASASITYFPSPSEIAPTGHSPAQAPQLMQSSEIIYAIYKHLRDLLRQIIVRPVNLILAYFRKKSIVFC